MVAERRIRRSSECGTALGYQLQSCAERAGLDFFVLACDDGFLVASSDWDREQCEDVAARLASLGLCEASVGELWRADRLVAARTFEVEGERLILAAGGCSTTGVEPELARAMEGVSRILAQQMSC